MNVLKAAQETMALARAVGMQNLDSDFTASNYPHLEKMLDKMEAGMPDDKMHRFLGWMQCSVYLSGLGPTHEDMKEINRRNQ